MNEKKEDFEARMEARLVQLRAKTTAIKKKAGGTAWKSLREGVEQAVDDLDRGLTGPTK